jgi:hypothetical protein
MLSPCIDIRIKNEAGKVLYFDFVGDGEDGEIVSSWQELTNTAKFCLPRKLSQLGGELTQHIQVGNEVVIKLGYDCELVEEFRGYITGIGSKIPLVIECQDAMWKLKQITISEAVNSMKLADFLRKIIPAGVVPKIEAAELKIGNVRFSKVTIAALLEKLHSMYGLSSYFQKGVLHVNFAYKNGKKSNANFVHKYGFERNIHKDENDLSYKNKKDVAVKIECISRQSDGKEAKYFYPSEHQEGELHTLHLPNGLSVNEMKAMAIANYDKFVYTGYRGSFRTFGYPQCDHGDVAELKSDLYPERNGSFIMDKVITKFGYRGYKRYITLGGAV